MKLRSLIIAALSIFVVWPALAQDSWTTAATPRVPFDFIVSGTTLPAGDYRIMTYQGTWFAIQNIQSPDNVVMVQNTNFFSSPGPVQKETKLTFLLNDRQHVLHRIAIARENHVHDLIHGDDVVELIANR